VSGYGHERGKGVAGPDVGREGDATDGKLVAYKEQKVIGRREKYLELGDKRGVFAFKEFLELGRNLGPMREGGLVELHADVEEKVSELWAVDDA
jgi:hypothetical protein